AGHLAHLVARPPPEDPAGHGLRARDPARQAVRVRGAHRGDADRQPEGDRDHLQLPGRADHLRRVTRGSTFRVARAHATAPVVVLLIFACHPLVPVGAADPLGEARRMLLEAKPLASRSKYDVLVAIAGVQAGAGDVTGALATAADLDELERRWWALK